MLNNTKKIVPIVFSSDKNYLSILSVSLTSILDNASDDVYYKFYVFHTDISKEEQKNLNNYNTVNSEIKFVDVSNKIDCLFDKLCVRDNYNQTIYYRFFIPEILKTYDKVIYLDCDTLIRCDIKEFYDIDLGDKILGVVSDEAVNNVGIFSNYTVNYLGVEKGQYFNSGVLLINVKEYNRQNFDAKLKKLIDEVKFKVAPDQDYLNVLFYNKVKHLEGIWNKMPIIDNIPLSNIKIIHYNLNYKPWHFDGILYEEVFWETAKKTTFYDAIKQLKENYGEEDKKVAEDNLKRLIDIIVECLSKKIIPFTRRNIF